MIRIPNPDPKLLEALRKAGVINDPPPQAKAKPSSATRSSKPTRARRYKHHVKIRATRTAAPPANAWATLLAILIPLAILCTLFHR